MLMGVQPAAAALTVSPGDLLMGFAKVNAGGTGYEGQTYVFNLGASQGYRGGLELPTSLGNFNADLTTAFGSGWANDAAVRWGIVGVVGPSDSLTNGDPARTTYFSQDYLGEPGGSAPVAFSSSNRGSLSTNLKSFFNSMNGIVEGSAVNGGALYASSSINSFSSFLPPGPATYFGVGINPLTAMTAGSSAGLDVYRTLHSATGADLSTALDGNAVVGTGQYVGTFTLSDAGGLAFVPEPSSGILAALAMGVFFRRRRA